MRKRINLTALSPIRLVVLMVVFATQACNGAPTPRAALSGGITPSIPLVASETPGAPVILPTFTPVLSATLPASPTPRPASTLGISDADLQGAVVQFWYPADPALTPQIDTFNSTNPWGIRIDAHPYPSFGEMGEAMENALTYGGLPDLLAGYNYQALQWDRDGKILADLAPYVNDPLYGWSAEEQADFYAMIWQQDVVNGPEGAKRLGIPWQRSGLVIFYNKTWAKELGFEQAPATPQEFVAQACSAAAANSSDGVPGNAGTGGWIVSNEPGALAAWLYAFGAQVLKADGTFQFNTPETLKTLEFLKDMNMHGCSWPSTSYHPNAEFAARKALFITSTVTGIPAQNGALGLAGSQDQWEVLPFPAQAGGQAVMILHGLSLSVAQSTAARQAAAWLVAKWLAAPENQAAWAIAASSLPPRRSTRTLMESYANTSPQWAQAAALIPYGRGEPLAPGWYDLRWALGDIQNQLYAPHITLEQIPDLLLMLDQLATEVQAQP